jgi:serine/threonine protein phosphatase PrpC
MQIARERRWGVVEIIARTDRGLVRPTNQDTLLIAHGLYGVADGMGGHRGGETASRVAVQVVRTLLADKIPEENTLRIGLEAANRRVFEMQRHDSALSGMGTTLTLLWEGAREIFVGHVGDSRAYLLRDGKLTPRTQDHSVVGELVRNKAITPEMAKNHPYRSVITRALGTEAVMQPDVFKEEKRVGDVWLVCSDGLHGLVDDGEMEAALNELAPEPAADKLLELALSHGGQDNISFVLGRVTEVAAP